MNPSSSAYLPLCEFSAWIPLELWFHRTHDNSVNRIGRISWSVVISSNAHNVICRVLQEPTVKRMNHAQKKECISKRFARGCHGHVRKYYWWFRNIFYRIIASFERFSDRLFVLFWKWRQHPVCGIRHPKSSTSCSIRITVWKILTRQK